MIRLTNSDESIYIIVDENHSPYKHTSIIVEYTETKFQCGVANEFPKQTFSNNFFVNDNVELEILEPINSFNGTFNYSKEVQGITISNNDEIEHNYIVYKKIISGEHSGDVYILQKFSLQENEKAIYANGEWKIYTSSGNTRTSSVSDVELIIPTNSTEIKFDWNYIHGNYDGPITSEMTFNFSGAKIGYQTIVIANSETNPLASLSSDIVTLGSEIYNTEKTNLITLYYLGSSKVAVRYEAYE